MNCLCGCGEKVKGKFALGHNSRVKGYTGGQFEKGFKHTEETKKKFKNRVSTMKGKQHKKESIELMRKAKLGKMGKQSNRYKEIEELSDYINIHNRAWKLFGKELCEVCNITNEQHIKETGRRLSMHNKPKPKKYNSSDSNDWMTVCMRCHNKVEK